MCCLFVCLFFCLLVWLFGLLFGSVGYVAGCWFMFGCICLFGGLSSVKQETTHVVVCFEYLLNKQPKRLCGFLFVELFVELVVYK